MFQFDGNTEFCKLAAGQHDVDLLQLMLELAGDAYPDLDRVGCLLEIDQLGVACLERLGGCCHGVRKRLLAISHQLYEVEGFHGNRESYYEPQNSYLNEVLRRRCGIPISLGILYMAVAARAGLKMFGVNTPGHFVVGCSREGQSWYVDPFTCGEVLDRATCKCRIEQAVGKRDLVSDEHFVPATPLEIVARVLRNLKAAYAMADQWPQVLRVQERLVTLLPQVPDERRDLGLVYLRLGDGGRALSVLEPFARACPAEQAAALKPSIQAARRIVAERN
jgi:regulator of sirC expression with transglutaminase-like and TPR domain